MQKARIDVLFINGIRDSGQVDVVRATPTGKIIFSTAGSCHVSSFLPAERVNVSHFAIDNNRLQDINRRHILQHDVIFCEIADPDSHAMALRKACKLYDLVAGEIPWVNNPHLVANTRREVVPRLLAGIDGVLVPAVMRMKPASADQLWAAIESRQLSLPVLVRPTGSHGGQGLFLVRSAADLRHAVLPDNREVFVTEFVDTGSAGVYAKYRFAVVAGEPLLRHVIYSNHWIVHSESRDFMAKNPHLQAQEAQIINTFETSLKPDIETAVRAIQQKIGLDYFGIDCAIKDGRLIIFEVNANMNILNNNQPRPNIWEAPIQNMQEKILDQLILSRLQPAQRPG